MKTIVFYKFYPIIITHRLASQGAGLGIHLIDATQCPYQKYINGPKKNNYENLIAGKLNTRTAVSVAVGKMPKNASETPLTLKQGEFIFPKNGKWEKFKSFFVPKKAISNAVKNWQKRGISFKLD